VDGPVQGGKNSDKKGLGGGQRQPVVVLTNKIGVRRELP